MDAVWPVAVVPEDDANGVADDRANQRTEKAEVLPRQRARFERAERAVRVLAIEHLSVRGAHRTRFRFAEECRVGVRRACDLVPRPGT